MNEGKINAWRIAEVDRLVDDFAREFGPLSREARIALARILDGYADAIERWKAESWTC